MFIINFLLRWSLEMVGARLLEVTIFYLIQTPGSVK
jgi:hypothetical protein